MVLCSMLLALSLERKKNRLVATMAKIPMFSVSKNPREVLCMKAGVIAKNKAANIPVGLPDSSFPR